MKELITLCARRPVTVIMMLAALGIAAIFSVTRMPLVRLPEMSVPSVMVETAYPGMAASDIRSLVTIPVEDALSPVKGIQSIRSISRDGVSLISLNFRWGSDPMTSSALVREAIDAVYPGLPGGASKPVVMPGDSASEAHAIVAARSTRGDGNFARQLAEYDLRARLRKIDGVGSVVLAGGEKSEQKLRLDILALAARGLRPQDFARLVAGETGEVPAGNAREGDRELVVISSGRPDSVSDLPALILPAKSGAFRLGDAGELLSEQSRLKSVFAVDGREAVVLEIYRRPGADPVRLSREIQKTLKETTMFFARDAEIFLVKDSTPALVRGIGGLGISAALGAVSVIAALFVFFRRLRYSLLAAISVPVAAAAGICVLALAGKSLNSMSLGGLALGIGMVSDNSVLVLDLLHRAFGKHRARPLAAEVGACTASVAASSAASTVTTAVVFVPVIFLPGPLGSLFGDTAIALISSITAGWCYAQLCLSSLFRFFFRGAIASGRNWDKSGKIEKKYRQLLAPALRHPAQIYLIAALASVFGVVLLFLRPVVFVNPDEAGEICVSVIFPPGTVLEKTAVAARELSRIFAESPGIKTVYGKAGAEDEDMGRRAELNYQKEELLLHCVLEKGAKRESIMAELTRVLTERINAPALAVGVLDNAVFPVGVEFSVFVPADRTETLLGLSLPFNFAIKGNDRKEVSDRAAIALREFRDASLPIPISVVLRPKGERPELRLYPNREAQAFTGITGAELAEALFLLNEGVVAVRLENEGPPLDVRITGQRENDEQGPVRVLENTPFLTSEGKIVYLDSLGRIERRTAESALARLDRCDVIYLDIQAEAGRNLKKIITELAPRFPWFSRADKSVFAQYKNSLIINICLVLILLYMTMGAQFESFLLPLIVMLSIPFSLAGAGPALLLFGKPLDSGAVMGLTSLFGLAVNNGLILFEIGDEKIRSGCTPASAVYGGASERLRPVLITSATTVFALMPLALNPQGASQVSMAVAMMGGLAASTLLSLFALPPALAWFFAWRESR